MSVYLINDFQTEFNEQFNQCPLYMRFVCNWPTKFETRWFQWNWLDIVIGFHMKGFKFEQWIIIIIIDNWKQSVYFVLLLLNWYLFAIEMFTMCKL